MVRGTYLEKRDNMSCSTPSRRRHEHPQVQGWQDEHASSPGGVLPLASRGSTGNHGLPEWLPALQSARCSTETPRTRRKYYQGSSHGFHVWSRRGPERGLRPNDLNRL